jgi:uncharacterized protein YbjT (DUF2867 family)
MVTAKDGASTSLGNQSCNLVRKSGAVDVVILASRSERAKGIEKGGKFL